MDERAQIAEAARARGYRQVTIRTETLDGHVYYVVEARAVGPRAVGNLARVLALIATWPESAATEAR